MDQSNIFFFFGEGGANWIQINKEDKKNQIQSGYTSRLDPLMREVNNTNC